MKRAASLSLLATACITVAVACGNEQKSPSPVSPSPKRPSQPEAAPAPTAADTGGAPDSAQLPDRGRTVYMTNCIACHNPDPTQDGALGPGVAGASRALLEARVIRGNYPDGYTPKRDTRVMVPLPFLEQEIDSLAAYLADPDAV